MRSGRAALLIASMISAAVLPACGAPASRESGGAVADAVRGSFAGGRGAFDNSEWGRLLAGGVRDGFADYGFFRENRAGLDAYLARVASADLASLSSPHLEALLMNAYNALTIRSILDHPGVSSIREIDGVWTKVKHRVGGFDLTLDEIEHNILRPFFKDPRIHFAVNCASRSCAPLGGSAFEGESIGAQLETAARSFLRDPRNVQVADGSLRLSKYFEWYGEDFTKEGWSPRAPTIPAFVALYATEDVAGFIHSAGVSPRVEFIEYDWALNVAASPSPAP